MKKLSPYIKNSLITLLILCVSFLLGLVLHDALKVKEHVATVFVFAVFLTSLLTDGYIYGIVSAVIGTLAVNYAFTFPFLAINFTVSANIISAVIMIIIALYVYLFTTKVKKHEAIKAEGDKERMRANLLRAVSHDLRTPLTTIYGSSSALLESRQISPSSSRLQC